MNNWIIKKIFLFTSLFLIYASNTQANYKFTWTWSGAYNGVYTEYTSKLGFSTYKHETNNVFLFMANTYNGWPAYWWCISSSLTHYILQNCYIEKQNELLNITWNYIGKVFPDTNKTWTLEIYTNGTWTGTTASGVIVNNYINNNFDNFNLSPTFFERLTNLMSTKDFLNFLSIIAINIMLLLFTIFLGVVGFCMGRDRAKFIFIKKYQYD